MHSNISDHILSQSAWGNTKTCTFELDLLFEIGKSCSDFQVYTLVGFTRAVRNTKKYQLNHITTVTRRPLV